MQQDIRTLTIKEIGLKHNRKPNFLDTLLGRSEFSSFRQIGRPATFLDVPEFHAELKNWCEYKDRIRGARKNKNKLAILVILFFGSLPCAALTNVQYDYSSGEPTPYIPYNTRPQVELKSDPSTFQAPLRLDFTAPLKPNGHVGVISPSFSGLRDGHTDRWGNLEVR